MSAHSRIGEAGTSTLFSFKLLIIKKSSHLIFFDFVSQLDISVNNNKKGEKQHVKKVKPNRKQEGSQKLQVTKEKQNS